jgi:hypothetical protein
MRPFAVWRCGGVLRIAICLAPILTAPALALPQGKGLDDALRTAHRAPRANRAMSVFTPSHQVALARENARRYAWAEEARRRIVAAARPWKSRSDEALWGLMFGPTLKRSWMVWSDGHCPACGQSVTMYHWQVEALATPWKVRCPHCRELFPRNDFRRFYESGLDSSGVFDPARADRSLLFNADHPDPSDPKHRFGVDDGDGYVEGDHSRWRFIGAYLIYGQWKQAVLGGIRNLAAAYVITGERVYAHKAAVMLDRVADLYPQFDFGTQGVMYEGPPRSGYVSTWHDACEETRELALAYDQIRDGIEGDRRLVAFLRRKAKQHHLTSDKSSISAIRANIEAGILRHALEHRDRIYSNFPRTEIAVATIQSVLGWPETRETVYATLDPVIEKTTAVDGVTGEKGLAGYTAFTIQGLALLLSQYSRIDSRFLADVMARHPRLRETYRFHIDTWCLGRYYPRSGDTGAFARADEQYAGVSLSRQPGLEPSGFTFLWQLYELTSDPAYVQVLYLANGRSVAGLPYDLFTADPEGFQQSVQRVIDREGPEPRLTSVHKKEWRLAILRAGAGDDARALWLDYDSGGPHGHRDGLNLGLFAHGLDLLPDLGYPPVQYGGWSAPRAVWYTMTAAHNTVVVDGKDQAAGGGTCTLWADGANFRAVRAAAPELIHGRRYERTAAMIDFSERAFYLFDLFRVAGGTDHTNFLHSHFGRLRTDGLTLVPAEPYGHDTQMRDFRRAERSVADGAPWGVTWEIEDRYRYRGDRPPLRLRYTDLTDGAERLLAEGWVSEGFALGNPEVWVPRVLVRRGASLPPLASTFVGVIEPYEGAPRIAAIRRLALRSPEGEGAEGPVAVEVRHAGGGSDLLIASGAGASESDAPGDGIGVVQQPDWEARLEGELAWARRDPGGAVRRVALCRGRSLAVGDWTIRLSEPTEFLEIELSADGARVVGGDAGAISVHQGTQEIRVHRSGRS